MTGLDGLISNPQLSVDIHTLYPSRRQAMQLWQSYLNNVDVLLKVLHIPTTQPFVFAAINNTKDISLDQSALLFSIYYTAVTSLCEAEILLMFGDDRQSVLKRFQRGLEVSLHLVKFLDSPTITCLQAISIYLVNIPPHPRRKFFAFGITNSYLILAMLPPSQRRQVWMGLEWYSSSNGPVHWPTP